jgi:hypothetical protein
MGKCKARDWSQWTSIVVMYWPLHHGAPWTISQMNICFAVGRLFPDEYLLCGVYSVMNICYAASTPWYLLASQCRLCDAYLLYGAPAARCLLLDVHLLYGVYPLIYIGVSASSLWYIIALWRLFLGIYWLRGVHFVIYICFAASALRCIFDDSSIISMRTNWERKLKEVPIDHGPAFFSYCLLLNSLSLIWIEEPGVFLSSRNDYTITIIINSRSGHAI